TSTTNLPGFSLTLDSEVLGMRGVATPAGRFNALLIRQTSLTSSGGQSVLELYFVPGVGLVRFVTQDGTVIDLIERSFQPRATPRPASALTRARRPPASRP